jgi:YD repeat-containing protein
LHGLVYQDGLITTIDGPLADSGTIALAINNAGQILITQGGEYFLYDHGVSSPIGFVGLFGDIPFFLSAITGLNDGGQITGVADGYFFFGTPSVGPPGSTTPPTDPGSYTLFSCPGGPSTEYDVGGGINNAGQVTGSCIPPGSPAEGFIYTGGDVSLFYDPIPIAPYNRTYDSYAAGLNNSGLVAGGYQSINGVADQEVGPFTGFVYDGTTFTTVLPPYAPQSVAMDVNDSGTVVGYSECPPGIGAKACGFITVPSGGPPTQPRKSLGCGCDGQMFVGEPIDVGSGNMSEHALDYTTAGQNPLTFIRHYNSRGNASGITTLAASLGVNWRSAYDRYLQITSSYVIAERADGQQLIFIPEGSTWTPDSDIDVTLTQSGSTWTLTDRDDTQETYTAITASEALLQSITARNGYTQTMKYNGSNQLLAVTDSYGRSLAFAYKDGLLETVTTPDKTTLTYGFNAAKGGDQLVSVAYDTSPATSITYQYTQSSLPFALTALIDENGKPTSRGRTTATGAASQASERAVPI